MTMQVMTTLLMQILPFAHDNVSINFDSYHDTVLGKVQMQE